ncbi:hypothetical protein Tco_0747908 [Tanacetum coccineum]|uniref:Uncharacterized protein n=1 Tax=Tanacetum coccineum TaxID=301880 RepID=A0ABQ4YWU0_9ASTR
MMSTPVFVDPKISTQADGAQSSRVPVPRPEDPYEAIRQAYLVETDTKSEPFEDPESEDSDTSGARSTSSDSTAPLLPDHPLTHTSPTLVPLLRMTVRMAVRVSPAMSFYESSPSSSPPDLPSPKRYRGTSELVEDDEEEDEEIDESLDSNSGSEDAENEGPTTEDEDPAAGDEGLAARDEGPGMRDKSLSLGGDEVVPEGQQLAAPVIEIAMGEPLGLGYGVSSQPHSTYDAASTLTEFELKNILIYKMEKSESYLAAPEHRDCYDSLKKSYDLDKDFFFSYDVYSLKRGRKDKDKDEDPSVGSDRGLKKRKTSKDAKPTTGLKNKDSTSSSSKGTKSQPKPSGKSVQSEEPIFEVADSDMPQDQEGNPGDNDDEPRKEDTSRRDWFKKPTPPQEPTDPDWHKGKTSQKGPTQNWLMNLAASTSTDNQCYKALSEKLDWENREGGDYPFDLSKPLPLISRGKRQRVPFEYFINNDFKYLQGGVSTVTYTTSTTKTKATQYDLPGIEDMVPNIWSPVKVAYDKYALWGISHWREQRKSFYAYARGRQSRGYVYSTKHILAVTHVKNRLINLSGDDVDDFAIALRMFTRSLVIQKRVEDLQLGVESYQKQISVTKPDTTRQDLRKMHPYTPYKDPQGFIYVDDFKRNSLMRSDELYKFSDGTLTRLLSSLEDITKNNDMEHLPKRRWSTLEKKRAHFMIKDINKLLKERRMMRSLEKFVSGSTTELTLRLLRRTIMTQRFDTSAGNPVKEILLKLNLPDHRSILTDSKMVMEGSGSVPEPKRLERVSALRQPTLTTWIDPKDGITYIDVLAYPPPAPPAQTPPSPEWSSSSLPISPTPSIVPTPILSPMISLTFPSSIASLAMAEAGGLLTKLGAHRPMLALEAWAECVDTRMTNMSRAGYDDHRLIHDMLVQQAALQHELQETRDRVTALEQERDRKER